MGKWVTNLVTVGRGFRKYSQAQKDEAWRMHDVERRSNQEISARTGIHPNSIGNVLAQMRAPGEDPQYRLPPFDGWCFIHDNIEVGRHA